ncbi:MAG: hypothetical protein ABIB47_02195 [Candidatus Woesearchaeota archaeon]
MKNKRGDITVTLLIILVFVLAVSSLFIFITSSRNVEARIFDARAVSTLFYAREDFGNFYLQQAGEEAIRDTYQDLADEEGWSDSDFEFNFKQDLKAGFGKYGFEEGYLKDLNQKIQTGDFKAIKSGDTLTLEIRGLEMQGGYGEISMKYNPRVSMKFDLTNFKKL